VNATEKYIVISSGFVIHFCIIICLFIAFLLQDPPDDGHRSNLNMLVKNDNTRLNTFVKVHLLVCDMSTKKYLGRCFLIRR